MFKGEKIGNHRAKGRKMKNNQRSQFSNLELPSHELTENCFKGKYYLLNSSY